MRLSTSALAPILLVACSSPRPPAALFDSRVPYEPLVDKLKASGGRADLILRPGRLVDLERLDSGKHYKFVVRPDGVLAIAPIPVDQPNDYVHPILGDGGPVRTAGTLEIDRAGGAISRVVVDQNSKAYCPPASSLAAALDAIVALGVRGDQIRVQNRPPVCADAEPAPEAAPRYGAVMAEVGIRFERMGRAMKAGRLDLAEFERGEIEEIFTEDLPRAEPPRESAGVNLLGVVQAFASTNLPELKKAIESRQEAAFVRAYQNAAVTCNGCHRASGHGFVEIPTEPGQAVPRLDPVPARPR
jgi:hypothetical protein